MAPTAAGGTRGRSSTSASGHRSGLTTRPILIAELATDYLGGDKARWLKQAYEGSYEKHPSIWAIMYLDTDEPHRIAGQPDWRLVKPDDGSALRMYQSIASSRRFQGTVK